MPRLASAPMLRTAALAALALLVPASGAGAQAVYPGPPQVLVVGDSLAVGMRPYLGAMLPGSHLTWDAVTGRTTPTGLTRLRGDLRFVVPDTVVISLGTNDGSDPLRFVSRIRRVLMAIPPRACVVWASINRPPRKGAFDALNRVLFDEAILHPRLTVVDWNAAVLAGDVTLPDRVHPDPTGFHYRARMYARAVKRGCAPAS